jgi:hypothetical protein
MRPFRLAVLLFYALSAVAFGQTKSTVSKQIEMPSESEVHELLSKANQKVVAFEEAVKAAKPQLDKIDPKLSANYLDAASTAHVLIDNTVKNGPSGYRLTGILATLDDLSLDAANASFQLLRADVEHTSNGGAPDLRRLTAIPPLQSAQIGCNDIAELLMHTTLRMIQAEETALEMLLAEKK